MQHITSENKTQNLQKLKFIDYEVQKYKITIELHMLYMYFK